MAVPDTFKQLAQKHAFKMTDASQLDTDQVVEADVVIVGTGAGGGVTAEVLTNAGLNVVLIEEGGLNTSDNFNMDEAQAYADLYQESAGRATKDGAISIFQGRTVGGTTVVNWTSSFRTPDQTLAHWATEFGVQGFTSAEMAPWFTQMEERLKVEKWAIEPNANNQVLRNGCEAKQWSWDVIPRNVSGCWNIGYCGMGCPTNAKQSMLVTTIPAALQKGARLFYRTRAHRILFSEHKAEAVECHALKADGVTPSGVKLRIKAPHIVLAGGAINSPALLLRSDAPDPHDRIGKRTTIHPVTASVATMPNKVEAFYGAPQSIYSDEFQWRNGAKGDMGFKLEVPPVHPGMGSQILGFHGDRLADTMKTFPHLQATIALLRDGFHEQSPGGNVELDHAGQPILDYSISDYMWQAVRKSYRVMAEIQFEAGAERVYPLHHDARYYTDLKSCLAAIDKLPLELHRTRLMTAHLMGGCTMGNNPENSVVNSDGRFHWAENLWVIDGSVFPTSIGANPQLSIYGMALKQATALAKRLEGASLLSANPLFMKPSV